MQESKKFVVYTVMVGGYDEILQPLVLDERFDYVLFTDVKSNERLGVWEIRTFDYHNDDKTRESRYPKMHPEELLPEYEASLYIDANVQIADAQLYEKIISLNAEMVDWAGVSPYPTDLQDCIYEHAYWILVNELDSEKSMLEICHFLRKEGYPRHNGLFENNAIFRKNNERCYRADTLWWDIYDRYSRRDQLSLGYALWRNPDVRVDFLLPKGERVFSSSLFCTNTHTPDGLKRRIVKQSKMAHFRTRLRVGMPERFDSFRELHFKLYAFPVPIARVVLSFLGLVGVVVYGPKLKYIAYKHRKLGVLAT